MTAIAKLGERQTEYMKMLGSTLGPAILSPCSYRYPIGKNPPWGSKPRPYAYKVRAHWVGCLLLWGVTPELDFALGLVA